ncbi:restriction endonuclease subunit S [Streptacidiphilus sp. N1-3]|uniref:Restriction endonuclease subunit S n=1 Tax=Streptacidiphilus alkalitolerans TaxID=3342712 RepID=A0ABV6WTV3_9ACTN
MTWPIVALKRLVDPVRAITYGILQAGPDTKGGIPYIRPVDMTTFNGVANPSSLLRTTQEIAQAYSRSTVKQGDVIISIGPSYGKVMILPASLSGANLTQGTARVAPGAEADGRYLYWALQSEKSRQFWDSCVGGATFRALNLEPLGRTPIPCPSMTNQRRIADFLDVETARIDRLMALRRVQRANLEERAYATVSEVLLPGILAMPAQSWPWTWMPSMPSDRPLVRLGYVCRLQNGLTVDGNRDFSGDSVTRPYLRVANVQAGHLSLESVTEITVPRGIATRTSLRPGDVLMTEGGDLNKLGRGAVWRGEIPECLHQNHVFALRPEIGRLDANYLALMTRTLHGRCYFESTGSKTTNLASTNSSKILSFPIPLPSISVQRGLARQAQGALDSGSAADRLLERQLALLAERRQALITATVTGQFDVAAASGRGVDAS